ncbi:MAG: carbohydrate kinase [Spirochaetaceae bacterium]|jgi:fructokinase|nr:carbohydrate kinase [Spirochaetaceae bacterium]
MILCCGGALLDMVPAKVDGLDGNEDGYRACPGGGMFNTANAIGRLGVPVQFLAKLSTDFFGETLISRLRSNSVGTEYLVRSGQHSTLAFVRLENGKEPQYSFYTEGSADSSLSACDIPAKLPDEIGCIVFGDIAMTMEPVASSIEMLVTREKTLGKRVISFDPNIRPFMIRDRSAYTERFERLAGMSTITKISDADYQYLYPGEKTEDCLRHTLKLGAKLAIATLGSSGAQAVRETDSAANIFVKSEKTKVVDTIGAGDTFHGAFLSYLELHGKMSPNAIAALSNDELEDALKFANRAAAIVCSRQGAQPPDISEMRN